MPRLPVSSRIANDFVRAIVIVTVAMCSSGGQALVARSSIAQLSSSPSPIAAGATHSMAVTPSGQVWTWGDNRVGQLGTGDTVSHASPVAVAGLSNEFIAVSAGLGHSLALDYLGRVWSWGLNSDGQLGDGSRTRRLAPILVAQASDVVAIAAGTVHSLALRSDGRVLAWGGNLGAQLGDGTQTGRMRPVLIAGLTDVIAIAAGTAHSLALRSDGSVWAWGTNLTGQLGVTGALVRRRPVRIPSLAGIALISAGGGHSVAVTAAGQVWSWGWNGLGQLGDGTRTTRRTPIAIQGLSEVSRISAGATHTLATTSAGELFAWGGNDAGQLGDGTTTNRLTPTFIQPPPSQVIEVAAGAVHSLLLVADRSAWSWGNNFFGQLGDASHITSRRPTPISGLDQTVAPPTFSPEGGTYDAPIEVTISTTTPNAVIHYTTNGDDPTESDQVADAPLVIDQTTILSARAFKAGMTESDVSIAEYVFAVTPPPDAPTFSHEGGIFSAPFDVTIATTTPDADIRYTLDDSEPHAASELYTGPLHIATATTIKARAFQSGRGSATSGVLYLFNFGRAATPTATPAAGMYVPPLNVTLTAQSGASIYFTLDGSVPSESSTLYVSPIAIAANVTLQARALHPDYTPSRVLTVAYVIDDSPTGPTVDPSTIAPPVDPTEQTEFAEATAFLYTGPNRLQRSVAPGAIVAARVTVLRGMVRDRNGAPIGGVRITALNEPGLGHTLTREDGMFDFAVNGGGRVTIGYTGEGYLPAQRTLSTGWNDFVWAPDVVITALDPQVTVVPMGSTEALAARGTPISDDDGTRQATLIVPEGGVLANIELADGTLLPAVSQLSIRATEYTVGPNGPASMPGDLPNTSGYTYAVELSADEAIAAHATRVTFDRPLAFYVENFLGFPVGGAVPAGHYDRTRAEWVPADNGRIVAIVSETNGAADLDLNGDALADDAAALTALGVTEGERRRLAVLYEPGQSLWRVPIPHFTPWDLNWPYMPPSDADQPNAPPPQQRDRVNNGCEVRRSIVECESQVLGERVGIAGTPFTLNYRSNRHPGSAGPTTITIPLTGATVPASLKRIDLEVSIAGRRFLQTFPPTAGATSTIAWDGKDAYGRTFYGGHAATVTLKHVYGGIYNITTPLPQSFGLAGQGPLIADFERAEFVTQQTSVITMRSAMSPAATIGGWSLDAHHVFDRIGNTIWFGDGGRRDSGPSAYDVKPWGAGLGNGLTLNGVLPDGRAVVSGTEALFTYVSRGGVRGGIRTGDSPPECQHANVLSFGRGMSLASGTGGQLYYAVPNSSFSGDVTRLCFGRASTTGPEGTGIFTTIQLPQPQFQVGASLAVDSSGVLYAATGPYLYQLNPGGSPVLVYTAPASIIALSLTPDGDVIMITDALGAPGQLRRWSASGTVSLIGGALTGSCAAPRLDGPFDPTAVMCPNAVAAAKDGSIIYADFIDTGSLVRRLWPDGSVTTLARTPTGISDLAIVQDDEIYATDNHLKRIVPSLAENVTGESAITSADGALVYEFAPSGRHLRTKDSTTGVTLFAFGYNPQGFLISVTDRAGLTTTIERDGAGTPQAIVGPYGHRTVLQVNADGYLTSIADPSGGTTALDYREGGLLTSFTTPNGHASHFDYEAAGRLISDRDAGGGELTLTRTDLPTGWSVLTEDDLGRQERYTVEETAPGRNLRTKQFADGTSWTRQDLQDGFEEVAPDGTRQRVVLAPDPRFGRQAEFASSIITTTPFGLARTVTVARTQQLNPGTFPPTVRSLNETTRVNGRQYSTVFDFAARTLTATTPAGRQNVTTFDTQGRITRMRTGSLTPVDFTYDARSRVSSISQGNRIAQNGYGLTGELTSIVNPLLQTHSYQYDAAGRIVAYTKPDTQRIEFGFDPNGNMTAITPPGRPVHSFSFTPVDMIERYASPAVLGQTDTTLTYATDKQVLQHVVGGQTVTSTYDAAGRLDTLSIPGGVTQYGYHPTSGHLVSIAAPNSMLTFTFDGSLPRAQEFSGAVAGKIEWTYDSSFRPVSETLGGAAVSFDYDLDSLLLRVGALTLTRDAANGLVTGASVEAVSTAFTYDTLGAPASRQTNIGATSLFGVTYTRDALGRIEQLNEIGPSGSRADVFTYDVAGRLAAVVRNGSPFAAYQYDGNGNRVFETTVAGTVANTFDAQDRLLSHGATTFQYTPSGDLQTRAVAGIGTTTYQYDALGSLRSVALPTGTTIEYVVDGTGRRIGRRVGGVFTHRFIYQTSLRIAAEVDSSGNVITRFVYGTGVNVPEYMIRNGVTYRIVSDHVGSPRFIVDVSNGSIAQELDYDPFGRVVLDTKPGFQPFGFAGGLYDPLTGLVRFGARDYDPEVGRWTAKDPVLFAGGDSNLYAYASNDPVNVVDPYGLCGEEGDALKTAADLFAGFGDELTSGFGLLDKSLTERLREELDIDTATKDAEAYLIGEVGADVWAAMTVANRAKAIAHFLFKRGGFLNDNRYLRIGWGQHKGREVFRISGDLIKMIKTSGHIDIYTGGPVGRR